jgi:hypothetical protein
MNNIKHLYLHLGLDQMNKHAQINTFKDLQKSLFVNNHTLKNKKNLNYNKDNSLSLFEQASDNITLLQHYSVLYYQNKSRHSYNLIRKIGVSKFGFVWEA